MPTCTVCGEHVGVLEGRGLLRGEHAHCRQERRDREQRERDAFQRLHDDAVTAAVDTERLDEFDAALSGSGLGGGQRDRLLSEAFEAAVDRALEDDMLTVAEERSLASFRAHFGISDAQSDRSGAATRVVKAAILRQVLDGEVPERRDLGRRDVPFNLMKSETLVWLEKGAKYHQTKTRREFRGSSQGLSIKVAKGVYYRPSSFKGRSVSYEETVHADTGLLGVTTKHLYFQGERERFRVRYDRIVSFEPYSDGIGIMRDNQRAKPESFSTGDGWFIYNLVTNLAQR